MPRRGRPINADVRVTGESACDPTEKAVQSLCSPLETHLRTFLMTSEEEYMGSAARESVSSVRSNSAISATPTTNIASSGNYKLIRVQTICSF